MVTLVIGGGQMTWLEVAEILKTYWVDRVVVVNTAIVDYSGRIDAAVTLHPSKLDHWLRRRLSPHPIDKLVSFKNHDGTIKYPVTDVVPYLWWGMTKSGSSGLYAVKVAMQLFNADKIILAGVPMDGGPHYHDPSMWGIPKDFREGWIQALPYIRGKVKSCSGWTADLLGEPTKDWATR